MTLDKIFKTSEMVTAKRTGGGHSAYTVKITVNDDKARIYFKGRAKELFEGKKIVPIVHNTNSMKRVYFAPESAVNASDAVRNPGYKLSATPKSDSVFITICSAKDKFSDFVGDYNNISLDADCLLYFIERPTMF